MNIINKTQYTSLQTSIATRKQISFSLLGQIAPIVGHKKYQEVRLEWLLVCPDYTESRMQECPA